MKGKICFCPTSIAWIMRNLKKTAKARFRSMLKHGTTLPMKGKRRKRRFSAKQLRAQRLFARRAKAGTLRRRR